MPFLRNVVRGRNVPEERLRLVAEHYDHFDGVSPGNEENRRLLEALARELRGAGIQIPLYWGNRNWHPLLADTLARMALDGVRRAVAFVTSAYSSYSSCRQYLEDIEGARAAVGEDAPIVEKIRPFFGRPGFIEAQVARLEGALEAFPSERRAGAPVLFTAHSIPLTMANGCDYARELEEVRSRVGTAFLNPTRLVYQSRSGPPSQPWLEPEIRDVMQELARDGAREVAILPIGFVLEHMEVVYDLDVEARTVASELGLELSRARTVSSHPRFVRMVRELVEERLAGGGGECAPDCCPLQPS